MPARRQPQQVGTTSLAPFALLIGVAGIGLGAWKGYPGVPVLWAALLLSAALEKRPVLTGRKLPGKGAQPAGVKEEELVAAYQMWRAVRWRLLVPTLDWWLGWPPFASWFVALAAAWTSLALPVKEPVYAVANPPLMFVTVAVMTAALRRKSGSPGLRLNSFPLQPIALLSASAGAAAGAAVGWLGPGKIEQTWPVIQFGDRIITATGLSVLGFLAGIYPVWSKRALAKWRTIVHARREWRPRWEALKFEPLPKLIDSNVVGEWRIDDFITDSVNGSNEMREKASKIATAVGGGVEVTILTRPNEANGHPIPGSIHPQKFAVVTAPAGTAPELADPSTPIASVKLILDVLMRRTCVQLGLPPAVLTSVDAMHAESSKSALWKITADWPDGPGWAAARTGKLAKRTKDGGSLKFGDRFMAVSGLPAVIDHRTSGGCMFVGLVDDDMQLQDDTLRPVVRLLAAEEQWRVRWEILKVDPAPDLFDVNTVGQWTVYNFETTGAETTESMRQKAPKIAPTVGAGLEMTLLTRNNSVDGREVPGSIHPRQFAVATAPSGSVPDISDPKMPMPMVRLTLQVWLQQVCDAQKLPPVVITSIDPVHADDSPVAMWMVRGSWPEGPGWLTARTLGFSNMLSLGTGPDVVIEGYVHGPR